MLRLIRPVDRNANVFRLLGSQLFELHTHFFKVQASDFFIELLRKHIHPGRVSLSFCKQFNFVQGPDW